MFSGLVLSEALPTETAGIRWQVRPGVAIDRKRKSAADRRLFRREIPEEPSLIVCDASFIGLATVLATPLSLAAPKAELIALIKPQFEVGREGVGKGGIVRDARLRQQACERVCEWLANQPGWQVLGIAESPITGTEGNIEYLIAGRRG